MMKSLSVGVSSTGCLVNSLSKLEVSRLSLCQMESKRINTESSSSSSSSSRSSRSSSSSSRKHDQDMPVTRRLRKAPEQSESPVPTAFSSCVPCIGFHFRLYAGFGRESLVRTLYEKRRFIYFFKNCPREGDCVEGSTML